MKKRIRYFWHELRRRRVLHSIGLYLAGGWVLLQIVDVVLMNVGFPESIMALSAWLVIIGLPIAALISWRYDITRDGVRRTPPACDADVADLSLKAVDYFAILMVTVFLFAVSVSLSRGLNTDEQELVVRTAEPNSIAVLPFETIGGQQEDAYLAQGLAEDILHRLANVEKLRVASRTASFELDTRELDISRIGQRLGVSFLLEGSVRREGDRLRVVAQLIDAGSGYHLWSGSYDRRMEDLFRIYDEISESVAAELKLTLVADAAAQAIPTSDIQAYDYFLQARSMLTSDTHDYDSFRRSTSLAQDDAVAHNLIVQAQGMLKNSGAEGAASAYRFFSQALDRDPGFAAAWAGQCQALMDWYFYQPESRKIEQAESSCRKALKLDPDLSEGRVALGDLYRKTGWFEQSVEEYRAALESDPGIASAWLGLGETYAAQERDSDAESAYLRAIELEPDDLRSYYALGAFLFSHGRYSDAESVYRRLVAHPNAGASAYNGLGTAYYMMEDFGRAAEAYRQVIATSPTANAYSNTGTQYYYNGQYEDAAVMYREAVKLAPANPVWWGNLGDALQQTDGGREAAAEAYRTAAGLAEEMMLANPEDAENLTNLAHYHARLGEDEQAMEYLNRALTAAPHDFYAHYYAALVHLEAGRERQAMDAIRRSVEMGYPTALLRTDPQFTQLYNDERFLELIGESAG